MVNIPILVLASALITNDASLLLLFTLSSSELHFFHDILMSSQSLKNVNVALSQLIHVLAFYTCYPQKIYSIGAFFTFYYFKEDSTLVNFLFFLQKKKWYFIEKVSVYDRVFGVLKESESDKKLEILSPIDALDSKGCVNYKWKHIFGDITTHMSFMISWGTMNCYGNYNFELL